MSRTELIVVVAVILFVTFAMGWFGHWLVRRVTRVDQADLGELERMAQALNEAEEMREHAITYAQERDSAVNRELAQTRAELEAAMDGLRAARHEAEYLRRALEDRG
jgi:prophage endopeptidase